MSCHTNKLDICRLLQNNRRSTTLEFDSDISEDTFVMNVYSEFGRTLKGTITGDIGENSVIFQGPDLPTSKYLYEIIRTHEGFDTLILTGKYVVTREARNCGCKDQESIRFVIQEGNEVINFSYSEVIIGGGGTGQNGKSAYEIAVENGFVGTVEEWLESLHGIDGQNGINGTDGIDGQDGKSAYQIWLDAGNIGTINDFLTSLKGETGSQGLKGDTGATGAAGTSVSVILASSEANAVSLSAANPNNIYFWE